MSLRHRHRHRHRCPLFTYQFIYVYLLFTYRCANCRHHSSRRYTSLIVRTYDDVLRVGTFTCMVRILCMYKLLNRMSTHTHTVYQMTYNIHSTRSTDAVCSTHWLSFRLQHSLCCSAIPHTYRKHFFFCASMNKDVWRAKVAHAVRLHDVKSLSIYTYIVSYAETETVCCTHYVLEMT